MGFFSKLIVKGPGGPASIAKTMLRAYNTCRALHPGVDHDDIMKSTLLSRYTVTRKMTSGEMEYCLEISKSIGDLIGLVIYAELPMAFSRDFFEDTLQELEKFYTATVPEELDSIYSIPTNIKNFIEHREYEAYAASRRARQHQHLTAPSRPTLPTQSSDAPPINERNTKTEELVTAMIEGDTREVKRLFGKTNATDQQIEQIMNSLVDGDTILAAKQIAETLLKNSPTSEGYSKTLSLVNAIVDGDEEKARTCFTMLTRKHL